jgi:IgGFc binding protein
MKRTRISVGAVVILGLGTIGATMAACGDNRDGFVPTPEFQVQMEAGADADPCLLQCSLDGRSVIQSCTGEVVETCADNLACGGAKCQEPCAAAGADRSSNGCEFYFASPRFTQQFPQSCYAAFVVNSSNQPATISLEFRGEQLDLSKALFRAIPNSTDLELLQGPIAPGESAILFLSDRDQTKSRTVAEKLFYIGCPYGITPAVEEDFGTYDSAIGESFHLNSNVPVGLTSMYPYGGAASYIPSATLVFPVSAWSKEHVIVDGWEGSYGRPATQIYASEDQTEVTVIGKKDVVNGAGFTGAAAGTPAKIMLSKGQFAQIVQTEELTGSIVLSNKPTVTVGGNECAFLPNGAGACDTLAQQIPPYEQWGSEYAGVGYRPRVAGTEEVIWYRMVAARDGTELDYDPVKPAGAPLTMSAGQLVIFRTRSNEPFVVRSRDAEHPFYVGIHMSGADGVWPDAPSYGGQGDPEFVNVVPTGQFMNRYSFYADPTYAEHSLVIVRKKTNGAFKDVWLECAGNLPTFTPIDTRGEYEYTRVDLSRRFGPGDKFGDKQCITGLQRMRSEGAFSATLWGWGSYASYGYPGGVAIRKLVDTPLGLVR